MSKHLTSKNRQAKAGKEKYMNNRQKLLHYLYIYQRAQKFSKLLATILWVISMDRLKRNMVILLF